MNWKEIYSREVPALYSYLLARGCSAFEAEDRIHEVFTAALSAGTRVENPRAYLFRAVRNALKRGARPKAETHMPEIVESGPNPGEGEAVNAALSALLLIYLGLVFALFPARSGLPSQAVERSSFSSISMGIEFMRGSDHD